MRCGSEESGDFLAALRAGRARLVPSECRVLLAVSGGPDSLALALGWTELFGTGAASIAHLDHGLRDDSAADAAFVAELATELGLALTVGRPETPIAALARGSLEEAARDARYAFLAETARAVGATHVVTGHTADDQVETVLFSLIRGTGPRGLAGMPARRRLTANIDVVRPMLEIRRTCVESFLRSRGRAGRVDTSNDDRRFARNRVRNELLPWLRAEFNPRVDEAILRLSGHAAAMATLLDQLADQLLDRALIRQDSNRVDLAIPPLSQAERYLVTHAFKRLLERQDWPRSSIGQTEFERLADLVEQVGPRVWDLPRGVRAERLGEILRVTQAPTGTQTGVEREATQSIATGKPVSGCAPA